MPITINGTGTITGLSAGAIASNDIASLAATKLTGTIPDANAPSGSVLQVVSVTKADTQTITGTSYTQISGLTASITPISSSSKILISVSIGFGGGTNFYPAFTLYRDSTPIGINSGSGTGEECSFGFQNPTSIERYFQVNHQYLDSPSSTSAITYSVYVSPMRTSSQTININTANSVQDNNQVKGTSTITVMEISA
jgi:hypothetical protein